jgi:molybdate transport system substrate-binding protein
MSSVLMAWAVAAHGEVTVYAPAAMGATIDDLAAAATQQGTPFKAVIGHSPGQARQIVDGAPADLFISADAQWMVFLEERTLLAKDLVGSLASTRLVLLAPERGSLVYAGKPGESLADQLGDGKLAIADPTMVPAGRFARAALEQLGAWSAVEGRLALQQDVRAVVAMVDRNEVPAGIAFASDLPKASHTRVVLVFPTEVAPPIRFPMAVIAGHDRPEVVRVFEFLRSPQSLTILKAHGFAAP